MNDLLEPRMLDLDTARRFAAAAACLYLLPGCGAKSDLPTDGCVWTVTNRPPVALTDTYKPLLLDDIIVEGRRVLVATYNVTGASGLDAPSLWEARTRVMSDDLATIGPTQVVLAGPNSPGVAHMEGISSAVGFGHRGGLGWDEVNGCRFVALAQDGSAAAAPVQVDTPDVCFRLVATKSGFSALTRPFFTPPSLLSDTAPMSLLTLDPSGHLVSVRPNITPESIPVGYAFFNDGSWLEGRTNDRSSVTVQRFSATGDALSTPHVLAGSLTPEGPGDTRSFQFTMTGLGSSALAVFWTHPEEATGSTTIVLEPLDEDGNADQATTITAPRHVDSRISVGAVAHGALLAWTGGAPDDEVEVLPVWPSGEPYDEPLEVRMPGVPFGTSVVGTPAGALLVTGVDEQLVATPLVCVP
jgi:hypothetical protein